jgi:hypothetical protein
MVPMSKTPVAVFVAVMIVVAAVGVSLSGQATRPQTAAPVTDQLVAEIRGLRADLAQAMSANIRAQLLVARLQLQEQRLNSLGAQLAEVRQSLAAQEVAQTSLADRAARAQDALDSGQLPPDEQRALESEVRALKHELSRDDPQEEQLRGREADLSGQLVSEQGRWLNFNDRLDELERALPRQP